MNLTKWQQEEVGNLKVKFVESGKGNEKALIMIPGWPVSACIFEPLMTQLEKKIYCIGMNLPGFGGSEFDPQNKHTFSYYANFLDQFRREVLKTEKVSVFGYSTGGVVAISFASLFPESIDKVIIFSAPYNGPSHWEQNRRRHHLSVLIDEFIVHNHWLMSILNTMFFKRLLARLMIRQLYAAGKYPKLFQLPRSFLQEIVARSIRMDSRAADQMGEDLITHDFSEAAKKIQAECLVIAADKDEAVPPRWSEKLAKELMPKGKFMLIREADHAVVMTEPEKIARPIVDFL